MLFSLAHRRDDVARDSTGIENAETQPLSAFAETCISLPALSGTVHGGSCSCTDQYVEINGREHGAGSLP